MQHLSDPPPPFKKGLKIPLEAEHVVMRALAKDRYQRFERIQDFANALERASRASGQSSIILYSYNLHSDSYEVVKELVWSPDSKSIASVSGQGWGRENSKSVHIWTIYEDQPYVYEAEFISIISVAWIENIPYIAFVENPRNEVYIINVLTRQRILNLHVDNSYYRVCDVVWSPNGQYIAVVLGSYTSWGEGPEAVIDGFNINSIEVRDTTHGAIIGKYFFGVNVEGELSITWSPDNTSIAFAEAFGGKISIWEVTGRDDAISYSQSDASAEVISWSPDGTFIASGGDDLALWKTHTGEAILIYTGYSQRLTVTALAWSPDSRHLAFVSGYCRDQRWDDNHKDCTLHIYNISNMSEAHTFYYQFGVANHIAWSPDGTRISIAFEDGTMQILQAP